MDFSFSPETLPFSCVIVGRDGRIAAYNSLAKRSFSFLRRGADAKKLGFDAAPRGLGALRIGGADCDYFAADLKGSTLFAFLSDPAFPREAILLQVLEESEFAFRKFEAALLSYLKEPEKTAARTAFLSRAFEEDREARRRQSAALAYLRAVSAEAEKPEGFSPLFFLEKLAEKLAGIGYELKLPSAARTAARLPLAAFGRAVLDLFSFADLFENVRRLSCSIGRENGKALIRFAFRDPRGFSAAFRSFLEKNRDGAALFLPLLAAMAACRRHGLSFRFFCDKGNAVAEIAAPSVPLLPEFFLGAAAADRDKLIEKLLAEYGLRAR